MPNELKEEVRDFWESNLCGSHFVDKELYSEEFYHAYREFRYRKTHHLNEYINWQEANGKKLLDIGLGVGIDGARWAQNGAIYYGVDLTEEAVYSTQRYFELLGLSGNISQGDAEKLSFNDNEFDIVYSHGVLHHTPDFPKSLREVGRVLKPGGKFILMIYSKDSFNYWIRIQLYFRLKLILEIIKSKVGIKTKTGLWLEHLSNFKHIGWSYLGWKTFPNHCTDGPSCKIAKILTKRQGEIELEKSGFKVLKTRKAHFPINGKFPRLERMIARHIGFHQVYWAEKT